MQKELSKRTSGLYESQGKGSDYRIKKDRARKLIDGEALACLCSAGVGLDKERFVTGRAAICNLLCLSLFLAKPAGVPKWAALALLAATASQVKKGQKIRTEISFRSLSFSVFSPPKGRQRRGQKQRSTASDMGRSTYSRRLRTLVSLPLAVTGK